MYKLIKKSRKALKRGYIPVTLRKKAITGMVVSNTGLDINLKQVYNKSCT